MDAVESCQVDGQLLCWMCLGVISNGAAMDGSAHSWNTRTVQRVQVVEFSCR
jgi:hypothetical protein